jgi:hypothetical protein
MIPRTVGDTMPYDVKLNIPRISSLPGVDSTASTAYAYRPQDNYIRDENDMKSGWTRAYPSKRRGNRKYRQNEARAPMNPYIRTINEMVNDFGEKRKAEYIHKTKPMVEDLLLLQPQSVNGYLVEAVETGNWRFTQKGQ